jgi:hypothetical protein
MATHKTGISTQALEKLHRVILKTERKTVDYYEMEVWAEDIEDAEALATNYFNDGHLNDKDSSAVHFTSEYKEGTLLGVYVEVG